MILSLLSSIFLALHSVNASPAYLGIPKMPLIRVPNTKRANVMYSNELGKRDDTVYVERHRNGYYCAYLVTSSTSVFKVVVDTGSAYTWVGAMQHNPYVMGSASIATGIHSEASYGDDPENLMTFVGETYNDTIGLGALIVHSQGIGVPTEVANFPEGIDGILGLGPTIMSAAVTPDNEPTPTVVDNLYSQGSISSPLLGLYFPPGPAGSSGLLSFGHIRESVLTSDVKYVPVSSIFPVYYSWGIDAGMMYGNMALFTFGSGVLDSGSPRIAIASAAFSEYAWATSGTLHPSGLLTITQDQYNNLETLRIHIGDQFYHLSPNAQIHARPSLNSQIWLVIQQQPAGSNIAFSLGIPFFQRYYVVLNSESSEIGFASHIHTDSTTN
ncbi:hypothetical protein ID866_7604 [Astraeus odoratus]|nr:hypothetical protein ID866_7604 [Astraeus odoratus]